MITAVTPEDEVKSLVNAILHLTAFADGVAFQEMRVWQGDETSLIATARLYPDACVTFHGCTHLSYAWATYNGPLGSFTIDLAPLVGCWSKENYQNKPARRTSGKAHRLAQAPK